MIKLDRIYTRGGDDGRTSLADGTRVPKHGARIAAQGDIDEANAVLGVARLHAAVEIGDILAAVQNDLFDLGADVTVPSTNDAPPGALRMVASQVARLEREIDRCTERLEPLTSFVLPGGTAAAAHLHLARTVVRRAERSLVALAAAEPVNPQALAYLNRLSDLLFVLARLANDGGKSDVLWQPGRNR